MLNSVNAKPKKSRLEVKMSYKIYIIFVILLVQCFAAGLIYVLWMRSQLVNISTLLVFNENSVHNALFGNNRN